MRDLLKPSVLVRILLPLLLLPALGIALKQASPSRAPDRDGRAVQVGGRDGPDPAASQASAEPGSVSPWEQAGTDALAQGDAQTALRHLTAARDQGGLSAEGLIALGDTYHLTGDQSAATAAWDQALRQGEPSAEIYRRLAAAHQSSGDYEALFAVLQALIELDPADGEAHYQLGLLQAAADPESALASLAKAAELRPDLAEPARYLEGAIRRAMAADPDPAYRLVSVGRALAASDRWEIAMQAFERATRLRPDYAEAWAYLGEARQQNGLDGFNELQEAYRLDPASLAANTFQALYWRRARRYDLALVYLHAAHDLDPSNPNLQAEIGHALAGLGEMQRALGYYQRAVELAPDDPLYRRLLAGFSIQYEIQVREIGLPAARQAHLLDRKDPAALDLMGQAYLLLENPLIAERFFHRALEIDPLFAPGHYHLGLLYLAEGQVGRARHSLERVLTLAPNTPLAEQAQKILQRYFP